MSIDQALAKTRGGFLARLFGRGEQPLTAEWLDALEEALLRSDLSVSLVDPLMAQLRDLFTTGELKTVPKALTAVRGEARQAAQGFRGTAAPRCSGHVPRRGHRTAGTLGRARRCADRLRQTG